MGDVAQRKCCFREAIMETLIKAPSKETVRQYMQQRQAEHSPPPDLQAIRRQLGWELVTPRTPKR